MLFVSALLLFPSVAGGQPIQTIQSEAQLAAIMCRNSTDEAANELLLDGNPQLVNVTLWKTLLNCASFEQHPQPPAQLIAISKLTLRVAEQINRPELIATSYYYLARAYARMSDLENAIQAFEKSRRLLEQAGNENSLSFVLADLGAVYVAAEDYEKARSFSEESLRLAGQAQPDPAKEYLGPIEIVRARSLRTLGEVDLHEGNHADAIVKLREALALYELLNRTAASYGIQMAEVLIVQARVYKELGEYGRAFNDLTKAHQVSSVAGDQNTTANIMSSQASLFLEQEDYAAARKYFNASRAIYKQLGNARDEARVLVNLGVTEQQEGKL